ncbi:MAG: arginine decarboxylase, pyruvoyl-dependent [Deltaproteobacteria bacterium]|nr:arginine decarboxylase, pyruvoyl-dependent [Deltaproteobacteria bacterium]
MTNLVPKRMFFTKGVGRHKNKLQSFEMALRHAGVAQCNLVTVSSIFPPDCKIIPATKGVQELKPGAITFVVLARESTDEPNRLISAGIGLAVPKGTNSFGYLSEHHAFGMKAPKAADLCEDMAATMLATTLGLELDPDKAWDERKQLYKLGKEKSIETRSIVQSAEGHKDGLWTTVVAMSVLLLD